jgi:dTDP-4-dehydrorhamnose reductase
VRVLLTGAAGQLGAAVDAHFRARGHDVTAARRADLDITRHADVMHAVADLRPEVIINCAAYNDVDAAEDDPTKALEVNAFAVRSLAEAAREHDAVLVHYSTDFVFEGEPTRTTPYTEADQPNPQSHYGMSKLLGEWFATRAPRHYVLRVESLFGGPAARSSIDKIVESFRTGREVRVFEDRVVSPTYVRDAAAATEQVLERGIPFGLYHCVNGGAATFLEIGQEIARVGGFDERLLVPVRMGEIKLKAKRPFYCAMGNGKLAVAGATMRPWREALLTRCGRPPECRSSE